MDIKFNTYIEAPGWPSEFIIFNVFEHSSFVKDLKDNIEEHFEDRDGFDQELKMRIMYYFWSKAEYEITVSSIFSKGPPPKKVDVYDQIMMNWDLFEDYVWTNKDEIKKLRV